MTKDFEKLIFLIIFTNVNRSQFIVSSAEDGTLRVWRFQEVFNAPRKNQRFKQLFNRDNILDMYGQSLFYFSNSVRF